MSHTMFNARAVGAALFVFAFATSERAQAQSDSSKANAAATAAPVLLRLRLLQQNESPLADAEVSIKSDKLERVARSDENGFVRVDGLLPGYIEIRVRRVGFKQAQALARVDKGNNDLSMHVDGASVVLDEVRIVGDRRVEGRLEDFEMRRKRGETSASITAEEIDKRNPMRLSQMLRTVPGLRVDNRDGNAVAISTRGKQLKIGAGLVDCPMRVMVDGVVMPQGTDIDQVTPKAAYGVEVFNGPASIPLKLQGMRAEQWCGLIAIWTRSG